MINFRKAFLSLLLAATPAFAAVDAVVTPGDWALYRGTSIASRGYATEAACVDAAKALNVSRTYTCRTSTGVAVTVTVDPPPPPPPPPPAVTVTSAFQPATIAAGESPSLVWSSTGATSCVASAQGQSMALPGTSGSLNVGPQSAPVSVVVACGGVSATATLTISSAPPPPPPPPPPPVAGDPCVGFPSDKVNRPSTALAQPAPGAVVTDPQFGSKIRRVTNAAGRGKQYVKTLYSTVQAWNADESRMLLLGAGYIHELYDGRTYALIRVVDDINPADGEQVYWDTSDPAILYYADPDARTFVRYNVETRLKQVVRDFKLAPTNCTASLTGGADPQFTSWGSPPVIGLRCGSKVFAYDAESNTVGAVKSVAGSLAPQASPDGTRFFYPTSASAASVLDFNMVQVATISGDAEEHGTITQTDAGAAFVAVQFDAREGIWSYPFGGTPKLIYGPGNGWPYPPAGTHVSGVAYRKPGWIVVAHVGQKPLGQSLLENEIVLANVDTGQMCRIAHSRTQAGNGPLGYFSEAHPVMSPSGTRIAFTSDWGGSTADTYVVELPGYQ